jgi:hypothetical protein
MAADDHDEPEMVQSLDWLRIAWSSGSARSDGISVAVFRGPEFPELRCHQFTVRWVVPAEFKPYNIRMSVGLSVWQLGELGAS